MSHEEFAVFKEDRQRYNVFQTCKDLASCVQDALGPMTSMVWNQQKIFFSGILNISQIIQMQVLPIEPNYRDIPTIKQSTNSTNFTFRRTVHGIHQG